MFLIKRDNCKCIKQSLIDFCSIFRLWHSYLSSHFCSRVDKFGNALVLGDIFFLARLLCKRSSITKHPCTRPSKPLSLFLSLSPHSLRKGSAYWTRCRKKRGEKWLATQAEGPINVHKSSSVTYTHTLSQPCRHI